MVRLLTGRRGKYGVLVAWALLAAAALPFGGRLFDVVEDSFESFLPDGAESKRVLEAQQALPGGAASTVVVVYERQGGITERDRAVAGDHAAELRERYAPTEQSLPVLPSDDGEALLFQVPVSTSGAQDAGNVLVEAVRDIRENVAMPGDGLDVLVTGPGATAADEVEVFDTLETTLVIVPVVVVAVLLLLIYRSPMLLVVPLLAVVLAYQAVSAILYGLVEVFDLTLSSLGAGVLGILVYALGIDYTLLLVARYRQELRRHEDRHAAMRVALRRSGPAILASAGTVAAGLLCFLLADLNWTRALGPIGVLAAVGAVVATTTLLPALLLVLGRWVFWPAVPRFGTEPPESAGVWPRVAGLVTRRPRGVWAATLAVLAGCAVGVAALNTPQQTLFRDGSESVDGQAVVAAHYAEGASSPVDIVAPADRGAGVTDAVSDLPGVLAVDTAHEANGLVYLEATLAAEPDSGSAYDTIATLREELGPLDAAVGGRSAINLDMTTTSVRDAQVVIPVVLAAVLLILGLLLRAVIAPLLMIATVILSYGSALGLSVLLFENVLGWHGQDATLPLLAFVFLVALGVDYSIFLMTRVREEATALGTRSGTTRGLVLTGGVITSAGAVLAATFSVLAVLPALNIAQLGFVVAVGILLDTLIVRSLLVPSLAVDLGRRIWWPSRLSRIGG